MAVTTIVLVDDHVVVRQGLKALLEDEPDFTIVGEANGGVEAVRICRTLRPAVVVLDIMMDDISGIEVIRQVKTILPRTAIVVLSMYGDKKHVLDALRAGANAYVVKKSASEELVQAVRAVITQGRYLGPSLADLGIDEYSKKEEEVSSDPYEMLSSREREVLNMAAHGYTNAEIAERLYISRRTVETHRANAMNKLHLCNQTDLLRFALRKGILTIDGS